MIAEELYTNFPKRRNIPMKKMKRLLCLLLVFVCILSAMPVFASAAEDKELKTTVKIKQKIPSQKITTYKLEVGEEPVKLEPEQYITINKVLYEFSHFTVSKEEYWHLTIPAFDGTKAWTKKWGDTISLVYKRHVHENKKSYDRVYHWNVCECGTVGQKYHHVDPATDSDKICTCGYKFSDNADLTTLWLDHTVLSPAFSKETTDYTAEVRTYLDVTATRITAYTFDARATVELPTDLTIREGANRFEIKVTAEDKTATKTYTVVAVKPVKVEDVTIAADGEKLIVTPKVTITRQLAGTSALSEAVEAKLIEMLGTETANQVLFTPQFSKWSTRQGELTLSSNLLKAIAEKGNVDLAVQTTYGSTLTIPAAELPALAEKEAVTICITREHAFSVLASEETLTLPETVTLVLPE